LKMVGFFQKKIPKLALRIFFEKRQNAIAWRFGF
jgi:hypothetical protein